MPRPHCPRRIGWLPRALFFYPGTLENPEEVVLTLDELEALRLVDLEGLHQEEAAQKMGVSRPTLGRILESAHRKVTEALVLGKILRIEGGTVYLGEVPPCPPRRCRRRCRHGWKEMAGDDPEEPQNR
ncbi:MAG: DUF134 domain-containing protein [Candidatus Caldatribacteriaceae bacterium]